MCYFFSIERRSWSSGRVNCVQQGGDLVVIDSPEEQVERAQFCECEGRQCVPPPSERPTLLGAGEKRPAASCPDGSVRAQRSYSQNCHIDTHIHRAHLYVALKSSNKIKH